MGKLHIKNDYLKQIIMIITLVAVIGICDFLDSILPYTYGSYIIASGVILVIWLLFIEWRITDEFALRCFKLIGILLILYLVVQCAKYNLFISDYNIRRYLWYMMYVPMIIVPYLLFCSALWVVNAKRITKIKVLVYLAVFSALLCILVLSNDIHRLFFNFKEIEIADKKHSYGLFYYIFVVYSAALYVSAIVIMIKKIFKSIPARKVMVPLVSMVAFMLYCAYYSIIGHPPITENFEVELVQAYIITVITYIEGCISIGIIPANFGYRTLFSKSSISAEIDDLNGNSLFDTNDVMDFDIEEKKRAMNKSILIDENTRLSSKSIKGGYIFWADDLTVVNELKDSFKEITEKISIQTELLQAENDVIKSKSMLEARNALYDRIAEKIKPQTDKILDLLTIEKTEQLTSDILPKNTLAKIAVYNAYIKRRSNLEIIAHEGFYDTGIKRVIKVSTQELRLSVAESLRYLELNGVECFVTGNTYVEVNSDLINAAYEMFELVLEQIMDDISVLAVNVSCDNGIITLRFIITPDINHRVKLDTFMIKSTYPNIIGEISSAYDEGNIIVKLKTYEKEGQEVMV